jgi:lipopolysaccharide export system protein LptA
MTCKFRAAQFMSLRLRLIPLPMLACALLLALPAQAEKADRSKPMVVEADQPGTVDLQRQVVVFNGNVVISQGSMVLRAERVELRETTDGHRAASAIGSPGKPATWRQRRDGVDETVEGAADRIEFDGRADTLRLLGNGAVRRLRGSTVADEITGAAIVWDNTAEVFKVQGGAATAANPTGRVRAVLSPRPEPASAPATSTAPVAPPLAPSRALGEGR